jgi:hypothetical protein
MMKYHERGFASFAKRVRGGVESSFGTEAGMRIYNAIIKYLAED